MPVRTPSSTIYAPSLPWTHHHHAATLRTVFLPLSLQAFEGSLQIALLPSLPCLLLLFFQLHPSRLCKDPLPSSLPFLGAPPSSIHRSCSHIGTVITWIHRQLLCGQSPQPESPKSHVFIHAFLQSWPMKYWHKKPSVPAIN